MSDSNNGNKNSLIDKLLLPIILAFIVGGSSPWWFTELKNTFGNKGGEVEFDNPTSSDDKAQSDSLDNNPESAEESLNSDKTNLSIEKQDVSSVEVNNGNEYSTGYGADRIIDSNVESYWSTKRGSILDIDLEFYFEKPKSLSQINIYSLRDEGSYTQPEEIKLIFFNDSEKEITSQTIMSKGSSDQWQEHNLNCIQR